MNYKKVFKNQQLRFAILRLFSFIPDPIMLKWQYRIKMGHKLNFKNPQRFTEKIQMYKCFYRDPLLKICSDKYTVRGYVESKGLGEYLNEIYGVYDSAEDIVFDKLPNSFVIKSTDGGGSNNIIICRNKENLDILKTIKTVNSWLNLNTKVNPGREWGYLGGKPRIIIEKLISNADNRDVSLVDYKMFCFDGQVHSLFVLTEREKGAKLNFFTRDWTPLNVKSDSYPISKMKILKPKNFDRMIEIAEILSKDFPHVRIDLYNIDGNIIFGETTFYSGSGYWGFVPDSFDFELGRQFDISSFYKNK